MYSQSLQDYVQEISSFAGVDPSRVTLLNESLACFIGVLGRAIGAETNPEDDLLTVTIHLLALSDGLSRLAEDTRLDGSHYLIGLGFEQTGELLARLTNEDQGPLQSLVENDHWYRLTLALLHYLAGGHRVQALSVLRHLESIASRQSKNGANASEYLEAANALRQLYTGKALTTQDRLKFGTWGEWIFGQKDLLDAQARRIRRLAQQITQRRDVVLSALGLGEERNWLLSRDIELETAFDFWTAYLQRLEKRGITTFTKEQFGSGFDFWLRSKRDLLVVLPTGSGKTIVGELRSALTLAEGRQVLWMLPTRALVRQTKREFRDAFEPLNVIVDELPTTEDFSPLFDDDISIQLRYIAITTPEKLASLLRSNPDAVRTVGLVVLDEAQILLEGGRGTTAEFVLQQLRVLVPTIDIILMSAFGETRDILRNFLRKLGREPESIVSDTRPTRRAYGILTNDDSIGKQHPVALIYPPGIQLETDRTVNPYTLALKQVNIPSNLSAVDIAQRFVNTTTSSGLRTVLFVQRKDSTETHAKAIASKQTDKAPLRESDIARLSIELGRKSVIEDTGPYGVAPHHAGLCPLEQHLVERWVRDGMVWTVVATPTLAQGVNLPFDLSIVSFTSRHNKATGNQDPIPMTDIQNMVGRAGRAGHVSDGMGLVAVRRERHSPLRTLDNSRRFFFRPRQISSETLGLARLVTVALNAKVDTADWLVELGGASFSEGQSLVHFVLESTTDKQDVKTEIISRMQMFPSIDQLQDSDIQQAALALEDLVNNVRKQTADDPDLAEALVRTGMPTEVLRYFIYQLRSAPSDLLQGETQDLMIWADHVVQSALIACSERKWYVALIEDAAVDLMFSSIKMWRAGSPIALIEQNWSLKSRSKSNRLGIGEFINHKLSLLAQFWGALAVCEEIVYKKPSVSQSERILQQLPTFVREGVSSLEELAWLRAIGNLDRVLAHRLAIVASPLSGILDRREFARGQIQIWRRDSRTIPKKLDDQYQLALLGVLEDNETVRQK